MTQLDHDRQHVLECVATVREGVAELGTAIARLPTSRVDGVPWGEHRQRADALLAQMADMVTQIERLTEESEQ